MPCDKREKRHEKWVEDVCAERSDDRKIETEVIVEHLKEQMHFDQEVFSSEAIHAAKSNNGYKQC